MSLADFYAAVCDIERHRGFACGAPIYVGYRELGERADRDPSKAGLSCERLLKLGLLVEFERGSGSGPNARDRKASRIRRTIPIPPPPATAQAIRSVLDRQRPTRHVSSPPPPKSQLQPGGSTGSIFDEG
jgi:hypothetical protein